MPDCTHLPASGRRFSACGPPRFMARCRTGKKGEPRLALRSIASRTALWVLAGSTLVLAAIGALLLSLTRT